MKVFIVLIVLVAILWGGWNLFANGWHLDTGSGEHTGYVTAVEKAGVFWKTGTVYIKTDLSSSQEDQYCVKADSDVYVKLAEAAKTKASVTVKYQEYFMYGFKNCNAEPAMVTEVK